MKPRAHRLTLPLTDDRLWNIDEVAHYAGGCDIEAVRRMPIPYTTRNADPEGRGVRLYDPSDVRRYFDARKRRGAA